MAAIVGFETRVRVTPTTGGGQHAGRLRRPRTFPRYPESVGGLAVDGIAPLGTVDGDHREGPSRS